MQHVQGLLRLSVPDDKLVHQSLFCIRPGSWQLSAIVMDDDNYHWC